jgi:hypothetical protein
VLSFSYFPRTQSAESDQWLARGKKAREIDIFAAFLQPADGRGFEELIRDLARAENDEAK